MDSLRSSIPAGTCTAALNEYVTSLSGPISYVLYCDLIGSITCLLISLLCFYYASAYLPREYAKLGRIMGFIGAFLRLLIFLIRIMSWAMLALDSYLIFATISTPNCETITVGESDFLSVLLVLSLVIFGLWPV